MNLKNNDGLSQILITWIKNPQTSPPEIANGLICACERYTDINFPCLTLTFRRKLHSGAFRSLSCFRFHDNLGSNRTAFLLQTKKQFWLHLDRGGKNFFSLIMCCLQFDNLHYIAVTFIFCTLCSCRFCLLFLLYIQIITELILMLFCLIHIHVR